MLDQGSDALFDLFTSRGLPGPEGRVPVLCTGSNANPAQIHRKFLGLSGDSLVVFLQAELRGAQPVFAGHVARYGAIPATIEKADVCVGSVLALLTPTQLLHLAKSEGGNYHLGLIRDIEVLPEFIEPVTEPYAFISRKGVLSIESGPIPLSTSTQRDVLDVVMRRTELRNSLEDYLDGPIGLRDDLEQGIDSCGLRQTHTIRHTPVDIGQLAATRRRQVGNDGL